MSRIIFSGCVLLRNLKLNYGMLQSSMKISQHPSNDILTTQWKNRDKQYRKVSPFGWFLLTIPITTFCLGTWQVQRKKWKEGLIKELELLQTSEPIDLPDDLSDVEKLEYRPVRIRGKFIHDRELVMGPRTLIRTDGEKQQGGGLISQQDKSIGYLIVTPFQLEGREESILVNRGWVPKSKLDPKTRQTAQITDTIELIGFVRKDEKRPQFTPKNTGDINFLYRDLSQMCLKTGAVPIFVDASAETTIPGGPIGGQTRVVLRNEHLSYILTWYSLSVFTAILWYRQIFLRIVR